MSPRESVSTPSNIASAAGAESPWYQHRWPWLLMSGPAAVLVAAVPTAYLAFSSSDGLVADDYYKQGLMINQQLKREKVAAEVGIALTLGVDQGLLVATAQTKREPLANQPITLRLVHSGQKKYDVVTMLAPSADGRWRAALPALGMGRYHAVAETAEWRIESAAFPASKSLTGLTLTAHHAATPKS